MTNQEIQAKIAATEKYNALNAGQKKAIITKLTGMLKSESEPPQKTK